MSNFRRIDGHTPEVGPLPKQRFDLSFAFLRFQRTSCINQQTARPHEIRRMIEKARLKSN